MYRQYENPRVLEKELAKLRQDRSNLVYDINHLDGLGLDNGYGYTKYDEMMDYFDYLEEQISKLEQRVNFAWQDEEYG